MTRQEWVERRAMELERSMPDEFPTGFAHYLAECEYEESH